MNKNKIRCITYNYSMNPSNNQMSQESVTRNPSQKLLKLLPYITKSSYQKLKSIGKKEGLKPKFKKKEDWENFMLSSIKDKDYEITKLIYMTFQDVVNYPLFSNDKILFFLEDPIKMAEICFTKFINENPIKNKKYKGFLVLGDLEMENDDNEETDQTSLYDSDRTNYDDSDRTNYDDSGCDYIIPKNLASFNFGYYEEDKYQMRTMFSIISDGDLSYQFNHFGKITDEVLNILRGLRFTAVVHIYYVVDATESSSHSFFENVYSFICRESSNNKFETIKLSSENNRSNSDFLMKPDEHVYYY